MKEPLGPPGAECKVLASGGATRCDAGGSLRAEGDQKSQDGGGGTCQEKDIPFLGKHRSCDVLEVRQGGVRCVGPSPHVRQSQANR